MTNPKKAGLTMFSTEEIEKVARETMSLIKPALNDKFATIMRFVALHPESVSGRSKKGPEVGSKKFILLAAKKFAHGRDPKRPEAPATIPDEMVSFVLENYFGLSAESAERAKNEHALSMGAENIVGDLLERFLAHPMETVGWVWCSGSIIRAVDFVKPPDKDNPDWILLQVKNRDNSENSSSSAIRLGTPIIKWHRSFSKKAGTNWADFPDVGVRGNLSEAGFREFARAYLKELKKDI